MTSEEFMKKINAIIENQQKMAEQLEALSTPHPAPEETPAPETPEETPAPEGNDEFNNWLTDILGGGDTK